ncbi:competence protein CoiA family protein [Nostoc sp. 106C]|uniref:competence protein CoiA n=1 Tax=Nostoc sp. 106C TaxID=1932667 RepID=UPI001412E0FC|nr:competence protein CoiA family protein [Nostoc sp. 106C]
MARDSQKNDGPFFCPKCHYEVILRKGRVKVHHFAHKPPVFCQYGQGESEYHRACKQSIFDCLSQAEDVANCELEKDLGKVVPDIYFVRGTVKVAIEVQISSLTMSKIIERTEEYNRLGVYVLWLPVFDDVLEDEMYAPKQWEKWLHTTYYGRVYYWLQDLNIAAIHFDEYQIWVEESNWYSSDGNEMSAGGYFKRSKRYRTPNHGMTLNILKDFQATIRRAWAGGDITVPNCKILNDKYPAWWK